MRTIFGAAPADLAVGVDRGFPGGVRGQPERGALPLGECPADGVHELVPVAARALVQSWPTSDYGYYDVIVTADTTDGFTYRYAGPIS